MAQSGEDEGSGSGTYIVIVAAILILSLFYLAAPGICIALTGEVPDWLMPLFAPLEWLYYNFELYRTFIEACA